MNTDKKVVTKKSLKKGIALVEVIAALGIAVIIISSLVSLSVYTLRSSLNSKLQLEATKIANRELELIRAYRDSTDWDTFIGAVASCGGAAAGCNKFCHIESNIDGLVISDGVDTVGTSVETINRSFAAYKNSSAKRDCLVSTDTAVRIDVTVSYDVAGVTKYTHLYTDLTNWAGK
jgi:hypothetical protein